MNRFLFTVLLLVPFLRGFGFADDLERIRERMQTELINPAPADTEIEKLVGTIRSDGSWPGINYEDASRTAFENKTHVTNIRLLSMAYRNQASKWFGKSQIKSVLSLAVNYWLAHDYIAANWHTNEISNPLDWACVLLLMDKELTGEQADGLAKLARRANLDAWGARPGGDRIRIAGIMAQIALWSRDEVAFLKAVQTMAGEIKITSGLGIKPDLGFHHRTDRVTSILAYGTGYAGTFAGWAARLAGTRFSFPDSAIRLLTDYYLDGICKSMVYGWFRAPGIMNRSMAHASSLDPVGPEIPRDLLKASAYRRQELENIVTIRNGGEATIPSFNRFFTHSEYLTHQRPGYFGSVRMFSIRNHNMEYPHNMESLKHHHYADGACFISVSGKEHSDIFPAWDWQKIPGATVVQKPALPDYNQIVKKGKTGFVGAATDGKYGSAAFDFDSPHDPLTARKAWFFFDHEFVCLGAGIQSRSDYPVATTLNQCLLNGTVTVKAVKKTTVLEKGDHILTNVSWIFHDRVAYLFPSPVPVSVSNKTCSGFWQDLVVSPWSKNQPEVKKDIFSAWFDHGLHLRDRSYEYIVVPGIEAGQADQYLKKNKIITLSNTTRMQAVYHQGLNLCEAVFYEPGSLVFGERFKVEVSQPGIYLFETGPEGWRKITVSDPSRNLKSMKIEVAGLFEGYEPMWKATQTGTNSESEIIVILPGGPHAGESVQVVNGSKTKQPDFDLINKSESVSFGKSGRHYVGEKLGGGVVFWVDSSAEHGLIAAESDLNGEYTWRNGPSEKTRHYGDHGDRVTFARGDGIFAGDRNTQVILAELTEDNYAGMFAARACNEYKAGGYGDWYLPSKSELDLLFHMKDKIGGFNSEMYWSSTEYNVGFAWVQNFEGYGGQYSQNKSSAYAVRCIRRF